MVFLCELTRSAIYMYGSKNFDSHKWLTELVDELKGKPCNLEACLCWSLYSTFTISFQSYAFYNKRLQTLFKDQLDRSKALCSFKHVAQSLKSPPQNTLQSSAEAPPPSPVYCISLVPFYISQPLYLVPVACYTPPLQCTDFPLPVYPITKVGLYVWCCANCLMAFLSCWVGGLFSFLFSSYYKLYNMELEVWETCTNPHVCINIELIPLEWTQIVSIVYRSALIFL